MPIRRYSAAHEVVCKSDSQIEAETARKWLARALACYRKADAAKAGREIKDWLMRGKGYADEALEHGALVRDGGETVAAIEKALRDGKMRGR